MEISFRKRNAQAFNGHQSITLLLVRPIPRPSIRSNLKLTFGKRVEVIEQHFKDDHADESAAFQQWHERLKLVQQLRNHIAHGYMLFTDQTPNPSVCIRQVNDLDDDSAKRLSLHELEQASSALTTVIDEFARLTGWSEPEAI